MHEQIIPRVTRESVTTVPATQNSNGAMARWIAGMRLTNTIAVSCEVWKLCNIFPVSLAELLNYATYWVFTSIFPTRFRFQ